MILFSSEPALNFHFIAQFFWIKNDFFIEKTTFLRKKTTFSVDEKKVMKNWRFFDEQMTFDFFFCNIRTTTKNTMKAKKAI